MKKNKMMRIASVLLIAVLMTTCAISGTFAKYVTSAEGTDSARVAKWGVEIEATGVMFNDSYKDEATTYSANETGDAITVQADTEGTKILAPGTEGSLAALSVTGTPEVDVEVTYDATLTLTGWNVTGDWDNDPDTADTTVEYCPIEITVGDETFKIGENNIADIAGLKSAVEAAIEGKTATYNTNTDLSAVNDDVVVSWAWDYEGNDDVKDTALGNVAADASSANAAVIELTITTTITQVD